MTAAEVARAAGVSVSAVSLVVNGKSQGRVSDTIAARVRALVDELGYVVDSSARSLSTGRSRNVLFIAPDLTNPFYGAVVKGVRHALGDRYQLFLAVTETGLSPSPETIGQLGGLRLGGLIAGAPSPAFLAQLRLQVPVLLVDSTACAADFPSVDLDFAGAARELARHLAGLGHRVVGYLDNDTQSATFLARRHTFSETARDLGLIVAAPYASSTVDFDAAGVALAGVWRSWSGAGVTAVVASTDIQAYAVLQFARDQGLRLPSDLSVAGFDDLPFSRVMSPALTSVALPAGELGRRAGEALVSLMSGEAPAPGVTLPGRLVIRESTARVR